MSTTDKLPTLYELSQDLAAALEAEEFDPSAVQPVVSCLIPFRCPVCNGQGLVSRPPHIAGDVYRWSTSDCAPHPCRACGGTGIVWGNSSGG